MSRNWDKKAIGVILGGGKIRKRRRGRIRNPFTRR